MADACKEGVWGLQALFRSLPLPRSLILVHKHPHFLFWGFFSVSAEHQQTETKGDGTESRRGKEAGKKKKKSGTKWQVGADMEERQTLTFEVV